MYTYTLCQNVWILADKTCHKTATFNRPMTDLDHYILKRIYYLGTGEGIWDWDCPISNLWSFYIGGNARRSHWGCGWVLCKSASLPRCSLLGSQSTHNNRNIILTTSLFLELTRIAQFLLVILRGSLDALLHKRINKLCPEIPQSKFNVPKYD